MNKIKDITGKKYGYLTAIKFMGMNRHSQAVWQFKCDCGQSKTVTSDHIVNRGRGSCGCARRKNQFLSIKKNAYKIHLENQKRRGLVSNLTLNTFIQICELPCTYCGGFFQRRNKQTNAILKFNTVDRIDNKKGYLKSNCQPTCLDCNREKATKTHDEFINHKKQQLKHLFPEVFNG